MRQVGSRHQPEVVEQASGLLLAEGARFNEAVSRLAPTTFMPKGVYRFRSHDDANRQQLDCLVHGMGLLLIKQTVRDKDIADRAVLERAIKVCRARPDDKTKG